MSHNLYQNSDFGSYAEYDDLIMAMDFAMGQRVWIDGSEPAYICRVDKEGAEAVVVTTANTVLVVHLRWITLHDPALFGGWPTDNTKT